MAGKAPFGFKPYSLADAVSIQAACTPTKDALVSSVSSISYRELEVQIAELAAKFRLVGITQGSIVWSFLPRSFEFIAAFIAAQQLEAVFVPISRELDYSTEVALRKCVPPSLILGHRLGDVDGPELGNDVIRSSFPKAGEENGEELLLRVVTEQHHGAFDIPGGSYLNFTSGTTNVAKAAICTPENIFWNSSAAVDEFGMSQDDVHYSTFPVHVHPHEIFARPLYCGGTAVLLNPQQLFADVGSVNRFGVTHMMSTPAIYSAVLRLQRMRGVKYSTLRHVESGGSSTPAPLAREWQIQNGIHITPVWGSAETSGIALVGVNREDTRSFRPLSSYYSVEVVDESGKRVNIGETGELRICGEALSPGYVAGNPHSGRSPFRDLWYYTGDLFTVISDDELQYQERETNIIKRNGMSVIPADVEAVLLEIPGVIAACVVGIDDSETGEMIAAALVSAPMEPKLSALNVIRKCRHKLPFFAVPQYVEFVEHLPCDENGKVLRRCVREHISEAVAKRSKRSKVNSSGSVG